jgi:hypothetical protein
VPAPVPRSREDQTMAMPRETEIDTLRRDAAISGRGVFMLRFLPLFGMLPFAQQAVRNLPQFDWVPLTDPRVLALGTIALAVNLGLARCNGPGFATCLRGILVTLIATPFLIVAFGIWSLPPIEWERFKRPDPDVTMVLLVVVPLMLAMLGWLLWWTILSPALATRRLLAARVGAARLTYADLMTGRSWTARSPDVAPHYGDRNVRSNALMALAIVIGVFTTLAVLWLLAQDQKLAALGVEFACLYIVLLLIRKSRQVSAVGVDALVAADERAPILYLRAFQDDAAFMQGEWDVVSSGTTGSLRNQTGKPSLLSRLLGPRTAGLLNTTGRLEEVIAQDARLLGPFVAIGDPNERLPQLGAARAYFDNDTWRGAVERWVDMAQLIVKVAGPTRWVRWELDTIIDRNALGKLVLLMPPVGPDERAQRWQNMMAELAATPWGPALARVDPRALVALRFLGGGEVSIVSGGKARSLDYALAMRILLSEIRAADAAVIA